MTLKAENTVMSQLCHSNPSEIPHLETSGSECNSNI